MKRQIDLDPPYQREGGVWSLEKKQLFIDSLLNGFDVPKLYFHDRTKEEDEVLFSVVDGKQRLSTIWGFMNDEFALAEDFSFSGVVVGDEITAPSQSMHYSDFDQDQQTYFRDINVDIVHVTANDDDEIEDLFSRLNNGEPLNAAEKRNAMGGNLLPAIRKLSKDESFSAIFSFKNRRMSFDEVAAKYFRLEQSEVSGNDIFCDLKKKHLDAMVRNNKTITDSDRKGLETRVTRNVKSMSKVFSANDPLLNKQSYPQLYYGWLKQIRREYTSPSLDRDLRSFLESFHRSRVENNKKDEEERNSELTEYGRLTQQGTNDLGSMVARAKILSKFFLREFPNVELIDSKRAFNDDERYVIWVRAGKQCQNENCNRDLPDLDDMHADHVKAHSNGGKTTLENAQALCGECNTRKGARS